MPRAALLAELRHSFPLYSSFTFASPYGLFWPWYCYGTCIRIAYTGIYGLFDLSGTKSHGLLLSTSKIWLCQRIFVDVT